MSIEMKTLTTIFSALLIMSALQIKAQQVVSKEEMDNINKLKTDWPDLDRFKEENAKLSPPAPGENRVVFLGNSITIGWIEWDPGFFKEKPYVDRGISGQTTPQMLVRFHQDVVDLKPAVVVILAGINDIAENTGPSTLKMIGDNLSSMCEIASANNIKVVLSSVLPANTFPWRKTIQPADKVIALNQWIKEYAAQHNYVYLDYYTTMVDEEKGLKKELTYDGVHPNLEGYKVMEPLAEKAIQSALGK
jgi:lysophospholipase L1-like esterase